MCSAVPKRTRAGWVGWSFIHQWNHPCIKMKNSSYRSVYTGPNKYFNEWFRLFPCNPFTLWNCANSVSNFSTICRSKTCTVRGFRVNEKRRCASFCPFICPDIDLFKLNVVLNFFKLSPTLLGIASKIVAIQHTNRRFLFLSSQYSTLSSQNNSLLLSPIVLLFYYQSQAFQLRFQFQSSGLSGSQV